MTDLSSTKNIQNERRNNMEKNNSGTAVATIRTGYEAKVGCEAAKRVGRNPNLKGIIQEVEVRDLYNASPKHIIEGSKAMLSKSTTAVRDDVLIMKEGHVIGRMQLKDTPKAIGKTAKQVVDGHYVGTALKGTKETVAAYNQAVENAAKNGTKITQKMTSTGISSLDTSRIATQTIGNAAGNITAEALGHLAKTSGVAGGAISGGIEIISSGAKLVNGDIDGEEFASNVIRESAGGAVSAAGGAVAAGIVEAVVATGLAATAAPLWIPGAVGLAVAVTTGSAIKSFFDDIFG